MTHEGFGFIKVLFVILILVAIFIYPIAYRSSGDYATFTVKDKERITEDRDSYYLIFTEDGEVFENDDSLLFWKWNSSDVYGELEVGKTYKAKVAGWRVHIFSMYRNVLTISEVTE